MYSIIADEDYDQQIIPLFSRIFDKRICYNFDYAFMNKIWESVIIPESIHLSGAKIDESDPREYMNKTIIIYRNIAKLIDAIECNQVYISQVPFSRGSWGRYPLGATVNTRPFIENFYEFDRHITPLFGFRCIGICDETETWGYANHADGFSFLGGTREFMERFYALCGGRDVVRQTFHAYDVSTDWPFSFRDGEAPAWPRSFDDPDAPVTESLRERIYHSVGWEATPYTEEEIRNSYAD